jgi:hypothetical protein
MPGPSQFPPFQQAVNLTAINSLIGWAGQNAMWMKNHSCPCIGDTGSPNPVCNVCFGRGYYWDSPQGPFIVLLTLISWIGRNVDMGNKADPDYGTVFSGHPIITIPVDTPLPNAIDPACLPPSAGVISPQTLWGQVNTKDIFIYDDAPMRFQATLRVGQQEILPAWHIIDPSFLTIPTTGAVVVEDPSINQPVSGIPYTVNSTTGVITLNPTAKFPTGWPVGTSYVVEYYSPPTFVVEEPFGGLAHVRAFAQGVKYPRRWKVSMLDLWLRDKIGLSSNLQLNQ